MSTGKLSPDQIAAYHRDGYVIVKGLFDAEEIELLRRASKDDKALDDHSFGKDDGSGAKVRLALWNHPGDGIYGRFARCHKLVDSVSAGAAAKRKPDSLPSVQRSSLPGAGHRWPWKSDPRI